MTRLYKTAEVLSHFFSSGQLVNQTDAGEALDDLRALGMSLPSPEVFSSEWNACVAYSDSWPNLQESVYKQWTDNASHPLHGQSGLAFGDPALHMRCLLDNMRIVYDGFDPDHLSTLLCFLGVLLKHRPLEEAVEFTKDHLNWIHLIHSQEEQEIRPFFNIMLSAVRTLVSRLIIERGGVTYARQR